MLKFKKSSTSVFKATKIFSVISLFLMFSFSVVSAQENNDGSSATTSNNETEVTTSTDEKNTTTNNNGELTTTRTNEKVTTTSSDDYDQFSDEGSSNKTRGLYTLGQIGYNGASMEDLDLSAGFTINALAGYQYLSFLAAEASLGFKFASRTEETLLAELSINYYAFDIKLYPVVFRYEFNIGGLSIIPRIGLGVGIGLGSLETTFEVAGYGSNSDSVGVTGITAVVPIGVTIGLGKVLVGLTVEPAFGTMYGNDSGSGSDGLSEIRVTVDAGYKF